MRNDEHLRILEKCKSIKIHKIYVVSLYKLNEKLNKSPAEVSSYLKLKLNDTIFETLSIICCFRICSLGIGSCN